MHFRERALDSECFLTGELGAFNPLRLLGDAVHLPIGPGQ